MERKQYVIEIAVGLFIIAGFLAMLALALQISGLSRITRGDTYQVKATFNNIGGLSVRSPVKLGGVEIGEVTAISLDPKTYEARVAITLSASAPKLPKDSSASILTEGLLGSQYISIEPGFDSQMLSQGDPIHETHSAMILENLIGQFLYQTNGKEKN